MGDYCAEWEFLLGKSADQHQQMVWIHKLILAVETSHCSSVNLGYVSKHFAYAICNHVYDTSDKFPWFWSSLRQTKQHLIFIFWTPVWWLVLTLAAGHLPIFPQFFNWSLNQNPLQAMVILVCVPFTSKPFFSHYTFYWCACI